MDIKNLPEQNLNTPNGSTQRLSTITERVELVSPKRISVKELTATSLSEMRLIPDNQTKPRESRTVNIPTQEETQVPVIEPTSQSSGLACLAK